MTQKEYFDRFRIDVDQIAEWINIDTQGYSRLEDISIYQIKKSLNTWADFMESERTSAILNKEGQAQLDQIKVVKAIDLHSGHPEVVEEHNYKQSPAVATLSEEQQEINSYNLSQDWGREMNDDIDD